MLFCHAGSASREDPSKGGTVGANSVAAAIGETLQSPPPPPPPPQQPAVTPPAPPRRPTSVQRPSQPVDAFQTDGEWKKWNEERERRRETWIDDPEWIRVESWLDEHPDFCLDYFLRFVPFGTRPAGFSENSIHHHRSTEALGQGRAERSTR